MDADEANTNCMTEIGKHHLDSRCSIHGINTSTKCVHSTEIHLIFVDIMEA